MKRDSAQLRDRLRAEQLGLDLWKGIRTQCPLSFIFIGFLGIFLGDREREELI